MSLAIAEDTRGRMKYLRVLSHVWLGFGVIALVTIPLYPYWQVSITIAVMALSAFLAVKVLSRKRQVRAASIAFCVNVDLTFYSIFLVFVWLMGGAAAFDTQAPALMLMGLTALISASLLGPRSALIVAVVNTVVLIATRLIVAPEADPRPGVMVFYWLVAVIAFLYESSMNGVFGELKVVRDGLESTVARRTAELSTTVSRLEDVTQELRSANRDLDIFSSMVAHDLRNPLLVIKGYSHDLLPQIAALGPDASEALNQMIAAETRMRRLIEGLLSFARLGQHALQLERVSMRLLAERLATEQKTLERGRSLAIVVEDLPDCVADAILMEQVLANLIANAAKFTRPRSPAEIRIGAYRKHGEIVYSVTDNGVGFPMESAGRLFSPLQRLHAQHEFEGTGIGLAAVERMMRIQSGRVWAKSEVDKGATFYFSLPDAPLADEVHADLDGTVSSASPAEASVASP